MLGISLTAARSRILGKINLDLTQNKNLHFYELFVITLQQLMLRWAANRDFLGMALFHLLPWIQASRIYSPILMKVLPPWTPLQLLQIWCSHGVGPGYCCKWWAARATLQWTRGEGCKAAQGMEQGKGGGRRQKREEKREGEQIKPRRVQQWQCKLDPNPLPRPDTPSHNNLDLAQTLADSLGLQGLLQGNTVLLSGGWHSPTG